jgi:hypothetical protein
VVSEEPVDSDGRGVLGKEPTDGRGVLGKEPTDGRGVLGKEPTDGRGVLGKEPIDRVVLSGEYVVPRVRVDGGHRVDREAAKGVVSKEPIDGRGVLDGTKGVLGKEPIDRVVLSGEYVVPRVRVRVDSGRQGGVAVGNNNQSALGSQGDEKENNKMGQSDSGSASQKVGNNEKGGKSEAERWGGQGMTFIGGGTHEHVSVAELELGPDPARAWELLRDKLVRLYPGLEGDGWRVGESHAGEWGDKG